jgi:hypothetical protein
VDRGGAPPITYRASPPNPILLGDTTHREFLQRASVVSAAERRSAVENRVARYAERARLQCPSLVTPFPQLAISCLLDSHAIPPSALRILCPPGLMGRAWSYRWRVVTRNFETMATERLVL